jgi:PAS domain S-box-containing protein
VLSRLTIAVRINLLLVLAAFGMLLNDSLDLWAMRSHMFEDKRAHLSDIMHLVLNDARGHMNRLGGAQTEQGRAAFFETVSGAKFGDSPANYFYIYDYDGVAVLHPDPSRQGRNRWETVYPNGVKMVPKFIEAGRSTPYGGFLEYEGPDGPGKITPKISLLRDVPELKIVLGVGAHLKDINETFLERLHLMASNFALAMLAIGLVGAVISRSIRGPLSNTVNKITRLANGDPHIAPANPDEKSELGQVDKALDVLRANAIEQQALQEKVREQNELLLQQHKESEERWRRFVDQAPVSMLMLDRNMVHLACSRRWLELSGHEDGSIGRYHYDVFTEVPEHWKEAHRKALAGETARADEEMFVRPDGGRVWVSWEVRPWLTTDESIGGITIMSEDVTERVLAGRALRESELRMRLAQEAAKAGTWESRPADKINVWSDNLWELFGLEPGQHEPTLGLWLSTIYSEDREFVKAEVKRAAAAREAFAVQYRLERPEAEPERWLFARGRPISDETPDNYFGVVIDISEQKLAEKAQRESELRMRLAQEAARVGAWEWRLRDNRVQWSDSLWNLYGVPKSERWEPTIQAWVALIHPADQERIKTEVLGAVKNGRDLEVQWRLKLPEGEPDRWFLSRGRQLVDASGVPDRYFGVIIDITEQKLMEKALRESEMRVRLAQESAKAGEWELSLADRRVVWPDYLWSQFGLPKPEQWEATIEGWASIIHPADRDHVMASVKEAAALGRDIEVLWRLSLPENEPERWLLSRGRPIPNANGVVDRYFGVVIDITEQKLMEEALRESEERQSFLLSLNDTIRAIDEPVEAITIASKMLGQRLNANQVIYCKTTESGEHSIITHDWNDGVTPGAFVTYKIDDFDASFIDDLRSGNTVAVGDVHADRRLFRPEALKILERGSVAAFLAVPFVKSGRLAGVLAVHKRSSHSWKKTEIALAQDVAERTWEAVERARVSHALRESEGRLKFALTAGEVGTWELSFRTGELVASDEALAFLNIPPGTTVTLDRVLERVYADDRHLLQEALLYTLETGDAYGLEWRTELPDGSIRWLETKGERRSVSGRHVVAGLIQDITKKVKQQEAIERAAKAESEFLSNMSHELRTPMHAILGYTRICATAVDEGKTEGLQKYLNNIAVSGKRLLNLLNDLLNLAKMEEGKMEYKLECGDIKDVVEHTLMELDPLIKEKKVQMSVSLNDCTGAVFSKSHLIQVLINLVSNAIKFSKPGSQIVIDVCEDRLSGGERGVRCRVIDDGPGIPEDELRAVFDKFVQSKKTKTGKGGTGLGLAICDHIIKAHGGRIWAENATPRGAAFTFVIPGGDTKPARAIDSAQARI